MKNLLVLRRMPALKQGCCCCCSLKTGVAYVAIYLLIFNIIVVVVTICKISSIEIKVIFNNTLSDTLERLLNAFNDGRSCWCRSVTSNENDLL